MATKRPVVQKRELTEEEKNAYRRKYLGAIWIVQDPKNPISQEKARQIHTNHFAAANGNPQK